MNRPTRWIKDVAVVGCCGWVDRTGQCNDDGGGRRKGSKWAKTTVYIANGAEN